MTENRFTDFLLRNIIFYRVLMFVLIGIIISLLFLSFYLDKHKTVMSEKCELVISTCKETIDVLSEDFSTCKWALMKCINEEDRKDENLEFRRKKRIGERSGYVENYNICDSMDFSNDSDSSLLLLCR